MGWNWVTHLAKHCRLHVITEGEWKKEIEEEVAKLPQRGNLTFYYIPVSEKVRRMCWNQGDWRFYFYYRKWQKKALALARAIVAQHPIDVIHQLNLTGYREPGYLWRIKEVPYVWGPVGGAELMSLAYLEGADRKIRFFYAIKNIINKLQCMYHPRVRRAIHRADVIVAGVKGVQKILASHYNKRIYHITETGTAGQMQGLQKQWSPGGQFNILWVAKFDFRKQLGLTIKTIAATQNKAVHLHICGTGSDKEVSEYRRLAEQCGVTERCHWHGQIGHDEIYQKMLQSDLLFFPSIMESTAAVVIEAITVGLPVLCFNAFGYGEFVHIFAGTALELTTPKQSIADFAKEINRLEANRDILKEISAREIERRDSLSWDSRAQQMVELYCHAMQMPKETIKG